MQNNPAIYHRRSIRLKHYDYSSPGAYFVTICTQDKACVLGDIVGEQMRLNTAGQRVRNEWAKLCDRFDTVKLDTCVVMPNHLHGILHLVGAQFIAPSSPNNAPLSPNKQSVSLLNQGAINRAPTVGEIVRAFKAASTRHLRQDGMTCFAWQRNYYEHIVRDEKSLHAIRLYIQNNPIQWHLDQENPLRQERSTVAYDKLHLSIPES